ncbi:MAG: ATP-dependent helicase [Desulfatibacillaceae bacterium]|nr:ATP-dependent helicase [Desulfatibacillaceae bacterium]
MKIIDYQNDLNPAQYEAVATTSGPVLVIAGAGSGKTRTLTYRVAYLVESGVRPDSILLLTFTRRAAEEMLRRAALLLDNRCDDVAGGTFHSFSHQVLRRFAGRLGFSPRFLILDRSDCEALVENIRKEIMPIKPVKGFPRKQTIASIFSACANKGASVEAILADEYSQFLSHASALTEIYHAYTVRKQTENLMDFDDLLLHTRALLAADEQTRQAVASRYEYIMVDEYQDTNTVQADILKMLGRDHANVMAVGDDCQSIYAFRGANFENIMRFPDVFPGTKIIRLEQNYRSTQPILSMTNQLVNQARRKYSKTLFTEAQGGQAPYLVRFGDEKSQSAFVVDTIRELTAKGVYLSEIAVLFRAGFHSFDLEVELTKARMPYIKMGGFKFMESAHIKDVLAHLRALAWPNDRLSWLRILALLDGVGPKTAQKTVHNLCNLGADLNSIKPGAAWKEGWERLKGLLKSISPASPMVSNLGKAVVEYYEPILKEQFDNWPKRARDLEQLVFMMERYDSLERFLADVTLEPPNTSSQEQALSVSSSNDRLVLSTVHSAKGLEWDTVFVIWALDGRFPSQHAISRRDEALEEELRLMYVASTRAKKRLYFTYPTDVFDPIAGEFLHHPSRFLSAVDSGRLRRL